MSYRLVVPPRVQKELDEFRGELFLRLSAAVSRLPEEPRPHGCKKLVSSSEWRVRVGEYRIKYLIDDARQVVELTRVGHRSNVY